MSDNQLFNYITNLKHDQENLYVIRSDIIPINVINAV